MNQQGKNNEIILATMSNYLNNYSTFIEKETIQEIVTTCNVSKEYAFTVLLGAACGLNTEDNSSDEELFHSYFVPMIKELTLSEYQENPYYKNIVFPNVTTTGWELKYECYQPYEAFVWNDFHQYEDGRLIPQIGFFSESFLYPAVLENDRIWMTITPNEIETMKEPIDKAYGNVLTFGLGLGYYAYMVSEKQSVDTITIVERDSDVIQLFKEYILPQFPNKDKVSIIQSDAFEYARANLKDKQYNLIFTDLWHDVSDGIDLYLKMKEYESLSPNTTFMYWIEKSIRCYIE